MYHCYHCDRPEPRTLPASVIGTPLEASMVRAVALLNRIEATREYYCWCDAPCSAPQCIALTWERP